MTAQPTTATGAPSATLVSVARLRGDESQRVFDVLLHSLAEPGTVQHLPPLPSEVPSPAWLALALADVDVAVAVVGDAAGAGVETAELIHRATDGPIVEVPDAAIVVCLDPPGSALADVAIGTALAPEDGARVGLTAGHLDTIDGAADELTAGIALTLSGPGVPGERTVVVGGLDPAAAVHLGNVDGRFPTGFDTWLFTPGGEVMAISRSTTVRLAATAPGSTNDTDHTDHIDDTGHIDHTDHTDHSARPADQNGRS